MLLELRCSHQWEAPQKLLSWALGLNYDSDSMLRSLLSHTTPLVSCALLLGCASQSDQQTRQLRELGDQVRRLQATSDRLEERLAAIENSKRRDNLPVPATTSIASEVPNLPVVKLAPEPDVSKSEARAAAGEGDEPRPLIVGEGSRVEARSIGAEPAPANASPRRAKDKSSNEAQNSKRPSGAVDAGKK